MFKIAKNRIRNGRFELTQFATNYIKRRYRPIKNLLFNTQYQIKCQWEMLTFSKILSQIKSHFHLFNYITVESRYIS